MNQPSPAIVTQGAVRRLPHLALLIFCLAYVLPGFIGREPWRSDDISAFGVMAELAGTGQHWFSPKLAGLPPEVDALLPYWLGAWALMLAPAWIAPDLAARIPFIFLLALTLLSTWKAIYYLARSPRAQPVAFAFGGEASAPDYARALADGGLLALIACLGLAQLSHETTPAQTQLCFAALSFYAIAAMPYRTLGPAIAGFTGMLGLMLSGAPSQAILIGLGAAVICALDDSQAQIGRSRQWRWVIATLIFSVLLAALTSSLDLWRWRIEWPRTDWQHLKSLGSLLAWFTWPAWPLVLWTLWQWRRQLVRMRPGLHLAVPLWFSFITISATFITPSGDRALLLALPAMAALSAFALPTLGRSLSALIDWFTLLFFSGCAFIIWVVWLAMQTGFPPQPAANVARLAPGFEAGFSILPFGVAVLATLSWTWLVKWRVGRHRAAIWKSLVLPAGGAALCWILLTTLWMPLLDFARSYKPLVIRIEKAVQPTQCLEVFGLRPGLMAALKFHTRMNLEPSRNSVNCPWLLVDQDIVNKTPDLLDKSQWRLFITMGHPTPGEEDIVIFQRISPVRPETEN